MLLVGYRTSHASGCNFRRLRAREMCSLWNFAHKCRLQFLQVVSLCGGAPDKSFLASSRNHVPLFLFPRSMAVCVKWRYFNTWDAISPCVVPRIMRTTRSCDREGQFAFIIYGSFRRVTSAYRGPRNIYERGRLADSWHLEFRVLIVFI